VVLNNTDVGAAATSHGIHITDGDKGDITVGGSGTTLTIDNNAVTNSKLATVSEQTIKGRAAGTGTGNPTDLTGTQVAAILPTAAASVRGVVVPPNNTTQFLRADGTWVAPTATAAGIVSLAQTGSGVNKVQQSQMWAANNNASSAPIPASSGSAGDFRIIESTDSNTFGSSLRADFGYAQVQGPRGADGVNGVTRWTASSYSRSTNVFSIVIPGGHSLEPGDIITVAGIHVDADGDRIVLNVDGYTVQFQGLVIGTINSTATSGTISSPWPSPTRDRLWRLMTVQPMILRPQPSPGWSWRIDEDQQIVRPKNIGSGNAAWDHHQAYKYISTVSRTSNVATITTSSSHGFATGDIVDLYAITGAAGFNTTNATITVTGATTFTYSNTGSDIGSTAAGSYASASLTPLLVTNRSRSSNIATLTTNRPHKLAVGDRLTVINVGSGYGTLPTITVASVPTTTTFTYANTGVDETITAASANSMVMSPINVNLQVGNFHNLKYDANGYHARTSGGSPWGLGVRYGSYQAVALAFFTMSAVVWTLPEAGTFINAGQIATQGGAFYGYGLRVDSAGTMQFVVYDASSSNTVLATCGASVVAGDTIWLTKFGTTWEWYITSGSGMQGAPKANSAGKYMAGVGPPLNGFPDVFGTMAVGIGSNSTNGGIGQVRFFG
jgi:hypothetical protein